MTKSHLTVLILFHRNGTLEQQRWKSGALTEGAKTDFRTKSPHGLLTLRLTRQCILRCGRGRVEKNPSRAHSDRAREENLIYLYFLGSREGGFPPKTTGAVRL